MSWFVCFDGQTYLDQPLSVCSFLLIYPYLSYLFPSFSTVLFYLKVKIYLTFPFRGALSTLTSFRGFHVERLQTCTSFSQGPSPLSVGFRRRRPTRPVRVPRRSSASTFRRLSLVLLPSRVDLITRKVFRRRCRATMGRTLRS